MNLTQLKYFMAVCTHKKVSDAAKFLHISQPSLSNSVKELEKEFGLTLFYRQHSGMQLSKEGEIFYELANNILNEVERANHIMHGLGSERKKLRLGVPPMIGTLVMPQIYNGFKKQYPDISLETTESGREDLLEKLSDDHVDVIFMPHNELPGANFFVRHISRLELVCCVSDGSELSKKRKLTAADLKNVPLVLFKDSFFQTEQIKRWFSSNGIEPNIILQTEQLSTVQTLIKKGDAAGFLFRELARHDPQIASLRIFEPIFADISLVWKKNSYMPQCMKTFVDYIENSPFFCME